MYIGVCVVPRAVGAVCVFRFRQRRERKREVCTFVVVAFSLVFGAIASKAQTAKTDGSERRPTNTQQLMLLLLLYGRAMYAILLQGECFTGTHIFFCLCWSTTFFVRLLGQLFFVAMGRFLYAFGA